MKNQAKKMILRIAAVAMFAIIATPAQAGLGETVKDKASAIKDRASAVIERTGARKIGYKALAITEGGLAVLIGLYRVKSLPRDIEGYCEMDWYGRKKMLSLSLDSIGKASCTTGLHLLVMRKLWSMAKQDWQTANQIASQPAPTKAKTAA